MKNFSYLIYTLAFVFFISCKTEDTTQFNSLEKRIQNEGYFPLAPNNAWLYENRKATIRSNGTYLYENDAVNVESAISRTNEVYENGTDQRIDYLFSPYDFGETLGGIFGALNQITKVNGEYRKKQRVSFIKPTGDGETNKRYMLELEDQKFLVDNPTVGQVISSKDDTFTSPDDGITIEYNISSYVVEMLEKMPELLSNQKDKDIQLAVYKDILHTRDVILIKKIVLNDSGGNRLIVNAQAETDTTGYIKMVIDTPGSSLSGSIKELEIPFLNNFPLVRINLNSNNIRVKTSPSMKLCKSIGKININTELKGGPMEIVTNQEMVHIDQYWAKGVGNIKNITSYKEMTAKISAKSYLMTEPFKVRLEKEDPECGVGADDSDQQHNTFAITTTLEIMLDGLDIELPVLLSKEVVVQNLLSYKQRKTLN